MSETYNGCDTGEYIAVPGPQGPQGQKGEQGLRGPVGPEGPQGNPGPMGPQGCQGPKGDRGPRGEKGDKGDPGTPGERGPAGPEGPRGCNGKNGQDGRVQWDELTDEQHEMLRGPMGPMGPIGPRGGIGPQGVQGATGAIGPQGPAGENGPQGPKGNTGEPGPMGPRGPQGPKGDPGVGLVHSDSISENTTWNSKTIAEQAMHGKVRWEHHPLNHAGIQHTSSGFAKDLVVKGRTVVNFVNQEEFKTTYNGSEKIEKATRDGHLIYSKPNNKPIVTIKGDNTPYTLIYKMTIVSEDAGLHEGDHAIVTIKDPVNNITTQSFELTEGINKLQFNTISAPPTEIRINFYTSLFGDDQSNLVFKIDEIMLLEGDYNQKIAPRYFWDTRGVGDRIRDASTGEKKRVLILESRGKNLINPEEVQTDKYISTDPDGTVRWKQGIKGDSASWLVYCKQSTYTLSIKAKHGMEKYLRMFVLGYSDVPSNGEPAKESAVFHKDVHIVGNYGSVKIDVKSSDINVLAIYVGHLATDDGTHTQYRLKDVFEYIQLEEGPIATAYDPYKAVEKRLVIPRSLMQGDELKWDDNQGIYVIENVAKPHILEPTDIKEESFLNTFEGVTYMYVKNKITSLIEAVFPINIVGEDYYTKQEWGFEGPRVDAGTDAQNFLKLPNGFAMQWKDIAYTFETGRRSRFEDFLSLKNICFALVQMGENDLDGEDQGLLNFTTFKTRISGAQKNRVEIIRQYQGNAHGDESSKYPKQYFRLRVLVIADLREPQ